MAGNFRRPGGNWSVSRIGKRNYFTVVLYEIDLLRYAYRQVICPREGSAEADVWIYLEVFLLHYRNLLDFFGKNPRYSTDLTIACPELIWSENEGLSERKPGTKVLARMRKLGTALWQKYEDGKRRPDTISRYLQHCTTHRTDPKKWFPVEMMNEIEALILPFEKSLPDFKPAMTSQPVNRDHFLSAGTASTHSGALPAIR